MRLALRTLAAAVPLACLVACTTPAPSASAPAASSAPAPAKASAPAPAAPVVVSVALVNPGFEALPPTPQANPPGWFTFQHAGEKSYEFALDASDPHTGARSVRIRNIGPEPYGAIAQSTTVGAANAGKTARFSAWLRTQEASSAEAAVLTVAALQGSAIVGYDYMVGRPARGTTGWTRYTIELPLPRGTERVEVGAMLHGKGTLWFDDATLEFVTP